MMDYLIISIRTIVSYAILIIALRFMGKREIGQLNLFDLIILLSIADVMVISIENYETNFFNILLPVIILTFLQKIAAYVLLKSSKIRNIVDGKPSVIIINGEIKTSEMKKQAYNMTDLLLQLRSQNIFNLEEVELAILEINGMLSVQKKENFKNEFGLPFVVSGQIEESFILKDEIIFEKIVENIGNNRIAMEDIICGYYNESSILLYLNTGKSIKIKLI